MKKFLFPVICLASVSFTASDAAVREERRREEETEKIDNVEFLFDRQNPCPGCRCCGQQIPCCCNAYTLVAGALGMAGASAGGLMGSALGKMLDLVQCKISESSWDNFASCIQNGTITMDGIKVGAGFGLGAMTVLYGCCLRKNVRVSKRRNHDD